MPENDLQQVRRAAEQHSARVKAQGPWTYKGRNPFSHLAPRWVHWTQPGQRQPLDPNDDRYLKEEGGQKPEADAGLVYYAAQRELDALPKADNITTLLAGTLNAEFASGVRNGKLDHFGPTYQMLLERLAMLGVQEADQSFAEGLAKRSRYRAVCGRVNSRGQGNHILVAQHIKVLHSEVFEDTAEYGDIQDLRPDVVAVVRLPDGEDALVVCVHRKSARLLGFQGTSPIRLHQNERLANHLARGFWPKRWIALGDWNCDLLSNPAEMAPLYELGFRFVKGHDQPTHRLGKQLDGFLVAHSLEIGTSFETGWERAIMGETFWNSPIGTSFTDHALSLLQILLGRQVAQKRLITTATPAEVIKYGSSIRN
jgi:hypothetical protein